MSLRCSTLLHSPDGAPISAYVRADRGVATLRLTGGDLAVLVRERAPELLVRGTCCDLVVDAQVLWGEQELPVELLDFVERALYSPPERIAWSSETPA